MGISELSVKSWNIFEKLYFPVIRGYVLLSAALTMKDVGVQHESWDKREKDRGLEPAKYFLKYEKSKN